MAYHKNVDTSESYIALLGSTLEGLSSVIEDIEGGDHQDMLDRSTLKRAMTLVMSRMEIEMDTVAKALGY